MRHTSAAPLIGRISSRGIVTAPVIFAVSFEFRWGRQLPRDARSLASATCLQVCDAHPSMRVSGTEFRWGRQLPRVLSGYMGNGLFRRRHG